MTLGPRSLFRLRLVAGFTVIGALAGGLYAALWSGSLGISVATGATDGAVLSAMEIFLLRRRAAMRLPFAAYFALRVALYAVATLAINGAPDARQAATMVIAWRDVEFVFAVTVLLNLIFSVNQLLGPGVLFAFAAGRYRRPRREERVLLYIDLCGSTGLAERLGELRFLNLLNDFYADVTEEIVREDGEIHKYVGDEVIATWKDGTEPMRPIRATFAAQSRLVERAGAYRASFGEGLAFRAAIHAGPVVIGELGLQKKEIALIGDAMNTAARILEAARETGADVLISAPYFDRMRVEPEGLHALRTAPVVLRGKSTLLPLVALSHDGGLSATTPQI